MAIQNVHSNRKIRIGISGGGLAGATLINALMRQDHLEVHIFESAPEFSESGAGVGIAPHAQAALQELGPELLEALKNAKPVTKTSALHRIGCGPYAGTQILDFSTIKNPSGERKEPNRSVHRAAFLRELLLPVPRSIMHANKKLVKVEEMNDDGGGGVVLFFQDNTTETFDALIGADGIRGYVREHILGGDHPASKAKYAGFWGCWTLVDLRRAKEVLGEEMTKEGQDYSWTGDRGFFLHAAPVIDKIQCIGTVADENWNENESYKNLDRKTLEEAFASWTNSPIKDKMIELLLEDKELRAYPQFAHEIDAPFYAKGRVCVMGDAAHAMTPWQGSGAAMAIEDAMILAALLSEVKEPKRLEAAFRAYDKVRRPRTQRLVKSSKETGRIFCGRAPGVGLEPEKLIAALNGRWNWIVIFDIKGHKKDALDAMAAML